MAVMAVANSGVDNAAAGLLMPRSIIAGPPASGIARVAVERAPAFT